VSGTAPARGPILVHDFAGHAFASHLSRALARRGHEVVHAYCGDVTSGQGDLARRSDDPPGLRFVDASVGHFERYRAAGRLRSELRYGRSVAALARSIRPSAVLSGNAPLVSQALLWRAVADGGRRVYWLQDFLGRGTRAVLSRRSALAGATVGRAVEALETRLLRGSDAVVAISEDFLGELDRRGISSPTTVVENWAPLDEIERLPKANPWSTARGFHDRPVALYAGTLGLKHDPMLLAQVAQDAAGVGEVVVVTEGLGREALADEQRRRPIPNLHLFDYVDHDELPAVLAAADVCLVLLEPDAGVFSVPSKVLAYLAAGRAVVGAMPTSNLAARLLARSGAGTVVEPGDAASFGAEVRRLLADEAAAARMGAAGRAWAEEHFDVDRIAERIEGVLDLGQPSRR